MKTTTAQKIDRMTVDQIIDALREDGYAHIATRRTAVDLREAAKSGSLLWTAQRITTTDNSRIDARPQ